MVSLEEAAIGVGLDPYAEATTEVRQSKEFKAAKASIYRYLLVAPTVSQGGVYYQFTSAEKTYFAKMATALEAEANIDGKGIGYGWQGEDF